MTADWSPSSTDRQPRYKDEVLPGGHRLRYYFRGDEYGFPNESGDVARRRYPSKPAALLALDQELELRTRREVEYRFKGLTWGEIDDLRKCPICLAVIESCDVLQHFKWHARYQPSPDSEPFGYANA